jgi:pyruvate/2-oxoglutarate dehydrogenase complex dihydrolipoamide acyltransferase (E2) component
MSKVEFIYGKGGKKVLMARRYAETLRKLGHGTYADTGYQTRMLTAAAGPAPIGEEPLVSEAIAEFARDNGVDIDKVVGTGKDGRIKKSDVEAVIAAQDLA